MEIEQWKQLRISRPKRPPATKTHCPANTLTVSSVPRSLRSNVAPPSLAALPQLLGIMVVQTWPILLLVALKKVRHVACFVQLLRPFIHLSAPQRCNREDRLVPSTQTNQANLISATLFLV